MKQSIFALSLSCFALPAYADVWIVSPTVQFEMPYRSPTGQQILSSATGGVFLDDSGMRQAAGYSMSSSALCCTQYGAWQVRYGISNLGSTPFEFVTSAEFPQFGVVRPGEAKSFEGVALQAFTGGLGASFSVQWGGLSAPGAMVSAIGLVPEPGTPALISLGLVAMAGVARRKQIA